MKAYLSVFHGSNKLGTLHLELYEETVPKTVQNFATILSNTSTPTYRGTSFHRIIPGFMAQGGDFTNHDGTGGYSIYGEKFADENFQHLHSRRGMLSMANAGPDTNGSQFFITFRSTPHLNGKHVVFGHVDLEQSGDVLTMIEQVATSKKDDRPLQPVTIVDCGVVTREQPELGNDEIDIDDIEARDEGIQNETSEFQHGQEEEEYDDEEEEPPRNKADAIKQRLRRLKQKMNQARQLNQQAVRREGEKIGSAEASSNERRRQSLTDKKAGKEAWQAANAKAMQKAAESGIDGKFLVEQADESIRKAVAKAEKEELNQFSAKDYHNPQGQHRNYVRSLKSLSHRIAAEGTDTIYNPLDNSTDAAEEREGARRLAQELQRRIEKSQKRAEKRKAEEGHVSAINKRNEGFNKKINRNYDKHTAEIRQNLERGTAL